AVLLGTGSVATLIVAQRQAHAVAQARPTVQTTAPAREPVVAAGRVEPAGEEFTIASELGGKLARVLVEEGDNVHAGQVVAELINTDYRARLTLALATLAEKEAQLERLRTGSREEERREAEARLREAEAQLETAQGETARRRPLLASGAVSRTEFAIAE